MLEVEISQIATYPTSLRLGLVVRYGKDGPVRFATAYVDESTLDQDTVLSIMQWATRAMNRALDAERAERETFDVDVPLF